MRAITAALAVLFVGLTVAAYGSGTRTPAPVKNPAPAAHGGKHPKADADDRDEGDRGDHGKGHGLGNTYCQSLKGTGGPAFGHCIAAKAHELRQHGKHR